MYQGTYLNVFSIDIVFKDNELKIKENGVSNVYFSEKVEINRFKFNLKNKLKFFHFKLELNWKQTENIFLSNK